MLGYSFMGKAHTNAYLRMPIFFHPPPAEPELVAICGRDEEKVSEAADRYGYKKYYTDWRKVINDDQVELVDNGLPNNMHEEPCIEAAEKGKIVFCEKPLGRNSKEAERMYRATKKAHVKNMVGFNYRFVPAIIFARQLIEEGYLGKILQFRAAYLQDWLLDPSYPLDWRMNKRIAGSGALGDIGSHVLDIARVLVGEVDSTVGITKTFTRKRPLSDNSGKKGDVDVDDAFIALLKFSSGAIGSLEASRLCAGRKNFARVEIHGTKGSLCFDLENLNELQFYSIEDDPDKRGFRKISVTESVHPFGDKWWPVGHVLGWEHAMVHEIYHLFNAVANDKPIEPLGATFYDGLRNSQILDAIARSARTEKWHSTPA